MSFSKTGRLEPNHFWFQSIGWNECNVLPVSLQLLAFTLDYYYDPHVGVGCGCPADIAQRAEQRAKMQIVDRHTQQIDADNRRRAAEIAGQIANEKF